MNTSTRTSMNALVCVVAILTTCIICSHSAEARYMRYNMKGNRLECDIFRNSECKGNPLEGSTRESDVFVEGACYKSQTSHDAFIKLSSVGWKTVSYHRCSKDCTHCVEGKSILVRGACIEERLAVYGAPYFLYEVVCGAKRIR
eukprot:Nk52_evm1s1342 gene=Nk52_evmTU1s1342